MTPTERYQYDEYARINKIQNQLQLMLDDGLITNREFRERFENEVVSVRRRLMTDSIMAFVSAKSEPVNWLVEGF